MLFYPQTSRWEDVGPKLKTLVACFALLLLDLYPSFLRDQLCVPGFFKPGGLETRDSLVSVITSL